MSPEEVEARARFREVARRARCAVCPARATPYPHHVITEQELRRRGLDPWDPRCALPISFDCHEAHHNRSRPIRLTELRDENFEHAFEVLGPFAYDYLRKFYAGADPRLESRLVH